MIAFPGIVQRVARSVVGIRAGRTVGCGFAAMANGVLVTSQEVVGFEREVQILLDEERSVRGVVLRVNVALDVALVLPSEPLGLEPLDSMQEAPEVGAPCCVVGRAHGGLVALPTHVAAVDRILEGHPHLEVVASLDAALQGSPLIDGEGLVRGLVTRRRGGARRAVLPTYAYEGGLESVNRSADELADFVPEYGCPRCDTIFEPGHDRCLECGCLLPHAALPSEEKASEEKTEPPPASVGAVRVLLATLGAAAGCRRLDARTWSFVFSPAEGEPSEMQLALDATGRHLALRVPLVRVVPEAHEFFYRFLLTLNDETLGVFKASVRGEHVFLSSVVSLPMAVSRAPALAGELATVARHYRGVMERSFGAEPMWEAER